VAVPTKVRAVYDHGVLRPLAPVDLPERGEVTILIVEDDVPAGAVAALAASGGAFGFLARPEEDVYTREDGEPV
jgi:predicted DNA-binding antitoxin AbrB/MazE fold protein